MEFPPSWVVQDFFHDLRLSSLSDGFNRADSRITSHVAMDRRPHVVVDIAGDRRVAVMSFPARDMSGAWVLVDGNSSAVRSWPMSWGEDAVAESIAAAVLPDRNLESPFRWGQAESSPATRLADLLASHGVQARHVYAQNRLEATNLQEHDRIQVTPAWLGEGVVVQDGERLLVASRRAEWGWVVDETANGVTRRVWHPSGDHGDAPEALAEQLLKPGPAGPNEGPPTSDGLSVLQHHHVVDLGAGAVSLSDVERALGRSLVAGHTRPALLLGHGTRAIRALLDRGRIPAFIRDSAGRLSAASNAAETLQLAPDFASAPWRYPAVVDAPSAQAASSTVGRSFGGGRVFRAASQIDIDHPELGFENAVALAKLVLELDGGPVPNQGKRRFFDARATHRLTRLGLIETAQAFGRSAGTASSWGLEVSASAEGVQMVEKALADSGTEHL